MELLAPNIIPACSHSFAVPPMSAYPSTLSPCPLDLGLAMCPIGQWDVLYSLFASFAVLITKKTVSWMGSVSSVWASK